jgi:phenylalanyl-tRNA synthetase alpha chain
MLSKLKEIEEEADSHLQNAEKSEDLSRIKVKFLGKKGELTQVLKSLGALSQEERAVVGRRANDVKRKIEEKIDACLSGIVRKEREVELNKEEIDISLPGRRLPVGKKHPITQINDEAVDIFLSLGFEVVDGPEIETDYYNFEALNIPKDHPARDMQDTFYISNDLLLRTHTSPIQARTMEKRQPPLKIIAPGTVYRRDSDVSHTPMFHQIEGLMVDEHITFADLKGVLYVFLHQMFGEDTAIRFRPSFFPFTEPSAEVDIQCIMCAGKGCRVCKGSGWIEILGSGMVNPEVFRMVDYDTEKVSGFAFGIGIERIAMLKYGVNDIRLFFENDARFLNQF